MVLAKEQHVTPAAIYARLKKAGVRFRGPTSASLREPTAQRRAALNHVRGEQHPGFRGLPDAELASLYRSGQSLRAVAGRFGVTPQTIVRHLKANGIVRRKGGFPKPMVADDGHKVQSRLELAVDNWLSAHQVPHTLRPQCPWPKAQRNLADFLANGDVYIEVWGTEHTANYDGRRQFKLSKYKACGAKLIELFPHQIHSKDFSPLLPLLA